MSCPKYNLSPVVCRPFSVLTAPARCRASSPPGLVNQLPQADLASLAGRKKMTPPLELIHDHQFLVPAGRGVGVQPLGMRIIMFSWCAYYANDPTPAARGTASSQPCSLDLQISSDNPISAFSVRPTAFPSYQPGIRAQPSMPIGAIRNRGPALTLYLSSRIACTMLPPIFTANRIHNNKTKPVMLQSMITTARSARSSGSRIFARSARQRESISLHHQIPSAKRMA